MTALCEECEARMKALDHSELVPFFNVRPDEEPAGVVKQGYLWRRVARKVMDTWERHWFILDDSKLYFISESDESHRINVVCELMLANIRELKSYEVPFCFEIAFANFKTTIVQAEGLKEYAVWIQALRNGIEKSLVSGRPTVGPGNASAGSDTSSSSAGLGINVSSAIGNTTSVASKRTLMRPVIERILAASPSCAECDRPNPEWVSLNIGCLVCIDCSGVHRSMGVHISKMRSLTLDDMEPAEYAMLLLLGNSVTNLIWETEIVMRGAEKPNSKSNYGVRDKFIRAKYQYKAFLTNPPVCVVDPPDLTLHPLSPSIVLWERDEATQALCLAAAKNEMVEVVRALAADADVSGGLSISSDQQLKEGLVSPLIIAIRNGSLEAAVLLIINGASITQEASQEDSSTPLEISEITVPHGDEAETAMTIFEEGGTRAICSYILYKAEQGVRLGAAGGYSPSAFKSGHGDASISKKRDIGPHQPKDDTHVAHKIGHSSSGSLTMKAKQFMSRAASPKNVESSTSPPTVEASGPSRYRGASDFGKLPMSPAPLNYRSKSISEATTEENVHDVTTDSSNNHDTIVVSKKKSFNGSQGGSKISQKMRTAFSSTDFLFPHHHTSSPAEKHAQPSTAPKEVFHQPFLAQNSNEGSASHHSGFIRSSSSEKPSPGGNSKHNS